MTAPEPAAVPIHDRSTPGAGTFLQRPIVRATLRALILVGGVLAAAFAFVCTGFLAAMLDCSADGTTGLCDGADWLVPVLEWPIVAVALLAPLTGAIAGFVKRRPHWLGYGIAIAALMFFLMLAVSTGQTSVFSD